VLCQLSVEKLTTLGIKDNSPCTDNYIRDVNILSRQENAEYYWQNEFDRLL